MFLISAFNQLPPADTMAVFKTTCYPWTNGSFKPLCYAKVAVKKGEGIYFDLTSFEREPYVANSGDILDDSCVAACFNFFPDNSEKTVCFVSNSTGRVHWFEAENDTPVLKRVFEGETFAGEDERGWYWGVRFFVGFSELLSVYKKQELEPLHIVKGNIYKFVRAGEGAHLAAVAEVNEGFIFNSKNLDSFQIVDY